MVHLTFKTVSSTFCSILPVHDPSKVICCKSFMQYGIPNCLSHISKPIETVPSEPITIEMTWTERQFQIHLISYFRSQYLSVFSTSLLKYYLVFWSRMGRQHQYNKIIFIIILLLFLLLLFTCFHLWEESMH